MDKMFVKVSRWKVSGTNKFMTSSNFDEFRTCEMCVHFHLLVFKFDCLPWNKWKNMRIVSPFLDSFLFHLGVSKNRGKTPQNGWMFYI